MNELRDSNRAGVDEGNYEDMAVVLMWLQNRCTADDTASDAIRRINAGHPFRTLGGGEWPEVGAILDYLNGYNVNPHDIRVDDVL